MTASLNCDFENPIILLPVIIGFLPPNNTDPPASDTSQTNELRNSMTSTSTENDNLEQFSTPSAPVVVVQDIAYPTVNTLETESEAHSSQQHQMNDGKLIIDF